LQINGYVNTDTYDFSANVTVRPGFPQSYKGQISTGYLNGSVRDGLNLNLDLGGTRGNINFSLRNGNEVWGSFDLTHGRHVHRDTKKFLKF
jgi:hypothetical protein